MHRLRRLARLLSYPASRAFGTPIARPINLTLSVTFRCSSRCKTCHVSRTDGRELSLAEWRAVFRSLGRAPAWVTVSGGDQFRRLDLPEIVGSIHDLMRPAVINLPMNALLTRRIARALPEIARRTAGSRLVLNLSVDDIGPRHDALRGVPRSFEKVRSTFELARTLRHEHPHVVLGLHTVISRFNVERIETICDALRAWGADSTIAEIAENRVELRTVDCPISPTPAAYRAAVAHLQRRMRERRSAHPVGRLVEALRLEYYDLSAEIVRRAEQVIPCYAGLASAHIAPDGELWGCCVRATPLGNLRHAAWDFDRLWRGERAVAFRRSVRAGECACPLASASYTNMLLAPSSLWRVARNLVY
jgi:MoaA/NifB/PqqE/SkfB family radical SAM enzyme